MDDKIKMIIILAGGSLVSFVLFFLVFKLAFPPPAEPSADMAAQAQEAQQQAAVAGPEAGSSGRSRSSAADAVMLYSSEMQETIPTNPKIEGADLIYNYRLIEGKIPAAGGATALFIDWIGVGGGVGPGFHGVGVGRRGPGVRF